MNTKVSHLDLDELSLLKCPNSGQRLVRVSDECVASEDGMYSYDIIEGVYVLLPKHFGEDARQRIVADFYATKGWSKTQEGTYVDTAAFVDQRNVSRWYTGACIQSIRRLLPKKGQWLLDVGSGPIPHPEYMDLQCGFEKRICVDLSLQALIQAREKLGNRGMYVIGDITQLPIRENTIDAAVSFHVFYHIPEERQALAFNEISKVLKKGGRAAIVYRWEYSPISWRLNNLFSWLGRIFKMQAADRIETAFAVPPLYFHAHSLHWFTQQKWPFQFWIYPFRVIDNTIMRHHFTDHAIWKFVVRGLLLWQRVMPGITGRYGEYPCIVIGGKR